MAAFLEVCYPECGSSDRSEARSRFFADDHAGRGEGGEAFERPVALHAQIGRVLCPACGG